MKKFIILIPVYNDWESVFTLLKNINLQIDNWDALVSVLIFNDASTIQRPKNDFDFKNIKSIRVINMKINQGHARCNATGLKYIYEKEDFDYAILMDGDGEDRPEELSLLFKKHKEHQGEVVTGNRVKRAEGPLFKICYEIHKYLTFIFTGHFIKFGNYSCLPKVVVGKMAENASTWSSFSGALTKLTKNRFSFPSIRGKRYFGPSQMSFFSLLKHSLAIIAVFRKTVFLRSFIFLFAYLFFSYKFLSVITFIPIFLVFTLLISVVLTSTRENLDQLKNSLNNISDIEDIN